MSEARSWTRASDEELFATRLKDLRLRLEETPLRRLLGRLHGELRARDVPIAPRAWLSTEWFTPHGVGGFAIPFWLAHPRLAELERSQTGSVEGEDEQECLQLMRHETGHVLLNAYGLQRKKSWREHFGRASTPYRLTYRPDPKSRDHVRHLPGWYAQSHPVEDFCETFAVWLAPGRTWRFRYARWPAMRKLRWMEERMATLPEEPRARLSLERTEELGTLRTTLGALYAVRRRRYADGGRRPEDRALRELFRRDGGGAVAGRDWLAHGRPALARLVERSHGLDPYVTRQVLQAWIQRAHALGLGPPRATREEVAAELARQARALLRSERRPEFAR